MGELVGSTTYRFITNAADPPYNGLLNGGKSVYDRGVIPNDNNGSGYSLKRLQSLELNPTKLVVTYGRTSNGNFLPSLYTTITYNIQFEYKDILIGGIIKFVYTFTDTAFVITNRVIKDIAFEPLLSSYKAEVIGGEISGTSEYVRCKLFFPDPGVITRVVAKLSLRGSIEMQYYTEFQGSQLVNNNSLRGSCPKLRINANTDVYDGNELAQCVFVGDKVYNQYLPQFKDYISVNACTLAGKCIILLEETDNVLDRLCYYGLLRYFLFQQITGVFSLEILRRRYTDLLISLVKNSEYSCYAGELDSEVEKYFVR